MQMQRLLKRLAIGYEHHGKDDDTPYLVGGAFVVALLFLGIVGAGSPLVSRFAHTYSNVASVIVAALVDMANSDRALNGAGSLTINPLLTAAAQAKADDMAARGYFAHFDPAGKGPWDWMKEAGYVYHFAGENLAIQFSESADVERAWLNSPAHRENLLDPRFTEVGIATAEGLYQGRPTTYVVQFFGTPAPVLALRQTPRPSAPSEPEVAVAAPSDASPAPTPEAAPKPVETPQKPANPSLSATAPTSTDVVVLGLVSDTSEPMGTAFVPKKHSPAAGTSTQPTTTPVLLYTAAATPDLERLVLQSNPSPFKRLQASPLFVPRLLIALLAALAAFGLAGALLRELEHWHVKHSFYAASLSAASVAVAFVAASVPSQAPILDPHPIAFASDPSAHLAVIVPADGRVYAAGAPAPIAQTASVASLDWNLRDLTKSPLVPLGGLIAIIGFIVWIVVYLRQAPLRTDARTRVLVDQLAAMTENLAAAERIGQFGSFFWDYQEPSSSFWSDEMFVLAGLIKRSTPPTIDTFIELAAPEDKQQVAEAVGKAKTQPGAFSFTFHAIAHDKSSRFIKVEGTTMIRDSGKAWRIHGFAHDISREVEIDRSKSEFVSLASHQLKTPLTAIRWLVEAAQSGMGSFTPEQRVVIDKIGRSTQNMITIVNDLLNVSRIEMNRLATQIEELDLKVLTESVIEEQRHAAEGRRIALAFTCGDDVPHVQADRNALRMIVQNLISNAIKYTPEDGSVSCDLSLSGARTQSIYLTVTDTGIGIPKAEQPRVFEKLHRASNAQSLAVEGTGLGLYIVKTVIEKAGGAITFDSTEGKGTTFTVTIPLVWKAAPSDGISTLA
jgi:signal transduction histidine kinase